MSDAEQALDAFFADDGLPARDQAFTHAVMARAARKRLRSGLVNLAILCGLGGLLLWSLAPALQSVGAWAAGFVGVAGPVLAVATLVIMVFWLTAPRDGFSMNKISSDSAHP